jgi:transposase InsO family protein
MENFHISRNGLTAYQRNSRPLTGDGVQEFAPNIGTAMLDSTVCDIYLVDEKGELAGRPILTAACDANTSFCLGYVLSWENDTNSLKNLMSNIVEDKVLLCKKKGIFITYEQWNIQGQLPSTLITDQGHEYTSQNFEQIAELGVTLINLPPYRPEMKGPVEKLFDLIQNSYKDLLKNKGVIREDFQERGAHDYRQDAILTILEFERIVIRCIIHYNCERILDTYPYSSEMLDANVPPFANKIWNWKLSNQESNLIKVSKKEMSLTLLPRTKGKFTRRGLTANGLRYFADGYKERFLQGGDVIVSYDPEICNAIWIKESNGSFVEFNLIEKRFSNMSLEEIQNIQCQQKQLVQKTVRDQYQSKIDLMNFIETVAETASEKKKFKKEQSNHG